MADPIIHITCTNFNCNTSFTVNLTRDEGLQAVVCVCGTVYPFGLFSSVATATHTSMAIATWREKRLREAILGDDANAE